MKQKALDIEEGQSQEFLTYREDHTKLTERPYTTIQEEELFQRLSSCQVVLLGDFHTFDQNSRNVLRLFKRLIDKGKKVTLGMELVRAQDQGILDAFLEKLITEKEFLEEINYQNSWRFPWGHYRDLFYLAREKKMNVLGLNSQGTLNERDEKAATLLAERMETREEEVLIVLFGEYHLVGDKLPKKIKEKYLKEIDLVVVHQNLDDLYWKSEKFHIAKFNHTEYSIQSSPPWVKYESLLYWYENILEDPDFDFHELLLQKEVVRFNDNINDLFSYLCHEIYNDIPGLENYNLYDYRGLDPIIQQIKKISSRQIESFFLNLLTEGISFKVPFSNHLYCPGYSMNRLSYLAGIHFLSQKNPHFHKTEQALLKYSPSSFFYFFFNQHLVGLLSSKMVNPYRKTDMFVDFKRKALKDLSYKSIISILENPNQVASNLLELGPKETFFCAQRIAFFYGELLFGEIRVKKTEIYKTLLKELFEFSLDEQSFLKIHQTVTKHVKDFKSSKKRFF